MTSSIKELAGPVAEITPAEAEACARLIARYARNPADGDLLAEALGIDIRTGEQLTAERIHRLAASIPARCPACRYLVTSPNHRILCRRPA